VGGSNNRAGAVAGWSVFLLLSLAAAGGMWYYLLNSRPLKDSDFTTVNGTLTSFEEKPSGKNRFLEFYVAEYPKIRFRVPADGYEDSFDHQAFFKNMKTGSRIIFKVETAKLANPDKPPLDPQPTVFVHEIRDEHMAYSTLAGRKKWEGQNKVAGTLLALFLTLVACGAGLGLGLEVYKGSSPPEGPARQRAAEPPVEGRGPPPPPPAHEDRFDRRDIMDEFRRVRDS
jgi:hypothetical protein